jgi:hypothetical protein
MITSNATRAPHVYCGVVSKEALRAELSAWL